MANIPGLVEQRPAQPQTTQKGFFVLMSALHLSL